MDRTADAQKPAQVGNSFRWGQLVIGIICMVMIANLQYGWTLFVDPISKKFGWDRASIQVAFTVFVLLETWLVPIEGWFVDKYGPRVVVLVGGVLCGLGWWMNSWVDSLPMLYLAAAVTGIGAGAVYGTAVGNALKWFPDRRGLAAGLTAMGFGAGSALTVVPIYNMIQSHGFQATFFWFGLGQGLVVFLLGWFLRGPRPGEVPKAELKKSQSLRNFTSKEMMQTPVFWVMYAMFVLVAAGGLMATAQIKPIANDIKYLGESIGKIPLTFWVWTQPAIVLALEIDRILNGITRPLFGWISDRIGRENSMFIAFMIEGVGIALFAVYGATSPWVFVILTGVVFFAWGEIFSLFPSTCGDTYGSQNAAANAGWLYTAKGTAALLVPASSILASAMGGWHQVLLIAAVMNVVAALMALYVLKPMRQKFIEQQRAEMGLPEQIAMSGARTA